MSKRLTKSQSTRVASPAPARRARAQRPKVQALPRRAASPEPVESASVPPHSGLRGSAPWASRHAAKHAAEAQRRNADPPLPGSARATLRTPAQADEIKARVAELHAALGKIRTLRKRLTDHFYELGQRLGEIREKQLYTAKGYNSFEAFAERELDFGKAMAVELARIPTTFTEQAAKGHGLKAILAALQTLETEAEGSSEKSPEKRALPLKPPSASRR